MREKVQFIWHCLVALKQAKSWHFIWQSSQMLKRNGRLRASREPSVHFSCELVMVLRETRSALTSQNSTKTMRNHPPLEHLSIAQWLCCSLFVPIVHSLPKICQSSHLLPRGKTEHFIVPLSISTLI